MKIAKATTVEGTMRAVKKLFADDKAWTQDVYARDARGIATVDVNHAKSVCFCLEGAVLRCAATPALAVKTENAIRDVLPLMSERWRYRSIPAFNDHSHTTIADIREVVDITHMLAKAAEI